MKAIVLSDSHGDDAELRWMLEECWKLVGPVGAYIHCGDGALDFLRMESFIRARDPQALLIAVKGNCDFFEDVPELAEFTLDGVRLMATHGHRFQVKSTLAALDMEARQRGCRAALFGHTHIPCVTQRNTLLVNPGSVSGNTLALLTIEDGQVRAELQEF